MASSGFDVEFEMDNAYEIDLSVLDNPFDIEFEVDAVQINTNGVSA